MHWSYRIAKKKYDPRNVPKMLGVEIRWDHMDEQGNYSEAKSVLAAREMVMGFGMQALRTTPSLTSRHTERSAVDMTISWTGQLIMKDAGGKSVTIKSAPRTGMNRELIAVGKTFGVIKYNRTGIDAPHWSDSGK